MRSEEQVRSTWNNIDGTPVISICCIAFNHAPFIEDALRGFLSQITEFPFEILIHDDASFDGTTEIIQRYAEKFPHLIRLVIQEENQYSQGKRAMNFLQPLCRGRYIAICEADDYWTDTRKLQIQVDFLENNPEYVISGHDAFIVNEAGERVAESKLPEKHKRNYTAQELLHGEGWILTLSWVYRNVVSEEPCELRHVTNRDKFFTSILGDYGGSKYHDDIQPGCYRTHNGGVWSSLSSRDRRETLLNTYFWIYRYYRRVGNYPAAATFLHRYTESALAHATPKALRSELLKRARQSKFLWPARKGFRLIWKR